MLISLLEKLNFFHLRGQITDAICVKMNGSNLDEKLSFKMLGFSLFSKLDWGTYIVSIAKSASKKIEAFLTLYFTMSSNGQTQFKV